MIIPAAAARKDTLYSNIRQSTVSGKSGIIVDSGEYKSGIAAIPLFPELANFLIQVNIQ